MRIAVLIAALAVLPTCGGIKIPWPEPTPPTPAPVPTPEPPPPDTHIPKCNQAPEMLKVGCWDLPPGGAWHFIEVPPLPAPPTPVGRCPVGQPQARGPLPHGHNRFDATPAVCKADWTPTCYSGRYCHPVACEGDDIERSFCEQELMGGTLPVWELRDWTGNLSVSNDQWFGQLGGRGEGDLRWCFPNGRACSKWLAVSR